MTTRGRVDCYINSDDGPGGALASAGRRYQELFANITGFLSGSVLTDLGISIVSYSTGSGPGRGLDFWDATETATGKSANSFTWVCYRFNNAPRGKFDMLILNASGSGQSLSPFNVSQNAGTVNGSNNSLGIVAWACAVHPSGSTSTTVSGGPWNGPICAPGSGTLGTPIWATSSNGNQPGVFPRANSNDGSYSSNRNYLLQMHDDRPGSGEYVTPSRLHLIATEGSFTIVQDYGLLNSYRVQHFGSYAPRPNTTPVSEAPYFMFSGQTIAATNDQIKFYSAQTYGATAGSNWSSQIDGGIALPTLASGTKNLVLTTIGGQNVDANIGSFNSYVASGSYDLLPLYVCAFENPSYVGILGIADYINAAYGMVPATVNAVSGTAAFGKSSGASIKLITPWSGSSPGSLNNVRSGRNF